MIEGQNKDQITVLTLTTTDDVSLLRISNTKSTTYPQPGNTRIPLKVADPSLSPRLRGQRHGVRVWEVAGIGGEKERIIINIIIVSGYGGRDRGIMHG